MVDRDRVLDIALDFAQRLICEALKPEYPSERDTRCHALIELEANNVRPVDRRGIAAEHALSALTRAGLFPTKCSDAPVIRSPGSWSAELPARAERLRNWLARANASPNSPCLVRSAQSAQRALGWEAVSPSSSASSVAVRPTAVLFSTRAAA